ncbi:hypothetical protein [Costertonia aggregata]|uniref:Uncharacterized protein n=1 Tax=Costertonia aggregata TaxID=343403 RepID=A0A7H9AMH9_9FLAO|nr:hypothetical protein [Costertonia aggregata]QLG44584.1 hypothetical protein HYG79_04220 [Costertonia aggregata]
MEFLFNNIFDEKKYNSLRTTSEKIKYFLENDIFEIQKGECLIPTNGIKCVPEEYIDLNQFDALPFRINESYRTDEYVIGINWLFLLEIFEVFKTQLDLLDTSNEIDFNLNFLSNVDEQLNYLQEVIKRNDPFKLKCFTVEYNIWTDELILGAGTEYNFFLISESYQIDYILGKVYLGSTFDFEEYSNLSEFGKSLSKFLKVKYCLFHIKNIQNLVNDNLESIDTLNDDIENYNAYCAAYFFDKIGLVKKMQQAGFTQTKIYSIIGKITSTHPKTIEKKLRQLLIDSKTSESIKHPKTRKMVREIDEILNDLNYL